MASPNCTRTFLDSRNFNAYAVDRLERLRFKIWMLASELKANGGTDYTAGLATTLRKAGITLFEGWSMEAVDTAELKIFYQNALSAGASVVLDPNVNAKNVKCIRDVPEDDLMKMLVLLECALGKHASPPG
jgi:hypothetical protein